MSENNDDLIVKLRGLPWSATTEDIAKFLGENGIKKIHLTLSKEGRPSGEAFVEMATEEDLERAESKDKEHMGSRYIEVFKVNRAEMDWVVKRSGAAYSGNDDGCVRLRGLPFGCSKEEIAQFFTGLEIVPNGITLLTDYSGRSSGEAYVQFANRDVAERALQKHREKIGHRWGKGMDITEMCDPDARYIEIFRSSLSEINGALGYVGGLRGAPPMRGPPVPFGSRPGPYDRGDRFAGGAGGGRYPGRGSRSFKGMNMSNNVNNSWTGQNGAGPRNAPAAAGNGTGRNSFDFEPWTNNRSSVPVPAVGSGASVQNHCIHMRGLPFKASQQDIAEFFRPIIPVTIHILSEPSGRPSGEADVTFASHEDAVRAMSKDKSHMQHRYIELFLNSSGAGPGGANNGNGGRFWR